MIKFEHIKFSQLDWAMTAQFGQSNIFQMPAWLRFLSQKQPLEPVVAAVLDDGHLCGYFFGLIAEKFGVRILGSPFRGWTTYFMGFNLSPEISRRAVLDALPDFAFHQLHCHYLEIIDPNIRSDDMEGLHYRVEPLMWFMLDLTPSEDALFRNMKHACRTNIRKAEKNGLVVEMVEDPGFADEYYAQYCDVMRRHALAPAFGLENVKLMIRAMLPTGSLWLVRVRLTKGPSIATGLFLVQNSTSVFWGAASWHEYQCLRPNEFLTWETVKMLKRQGVHTLHFGGYAEQYKEKFGCQDAHIFRISMASSSVLGRLIDLAKSPKSEQYRNWVLRQL